MDGRAQSESIGVILLTVVVVIVVSIGGAVVLSGGEADSAPLVEFTFEATADTITVTHAGGDTVSQSELTLIARGDAATERYGVDAANVSGDGDGQFEPSERFRRAHGIASPTMTVLVVHEASSSVLARESLDVTGPDERPPPAARFSVSPSDLAPGEPVTFDATGSSGRDIDAYRWSFDDGTTATGATVDRAFGSPGTYTVSLTVENAAGKTDTASSDVVVSAPAVRLESASLRDSTDDNGIVGPGQSVTVTATVAESGTGLGTVRADVSAFDAGTQSLADGDGDGTYEATFDIGTAPTAGDQSVTVTATDAVGTTDTVTTGPLTIDTTPPAVDRFEVSDRSVITILGAASRYRIDWSVSDAELASTAVSVNRTDLGDNPQATFSGATGSETYVDGGVFQIGGYGRVHEIRLVATDTAGNRRCVVVSDTADGDPDTPLGYSSCD